MVAVAVANPLGVAVSLAVHAIREGAIATVEEARADVALRLALAVAQLLPVAASAARTRRVRLPGHRNVERAIRRVGAVGAIIGAAEAVCVARCRAAEAHSAPPRGELACGRPAGPHTRRALAEDSPNHIARPDEGRARTQREPALNANR
eukprot:7306576-Prymnesium_polylepis.1